jgi:2-polyprenyl-3-methyl-5-hydroxy-6-metoxy-1,4-benzoquinol methylase
MRITIKKISCYSTLKKGYENVSNLSSTINEDEIKKFQKLSQAWWIENGEFEALHKFNELRVPWIRDTLFYNNKNYQKDSDNTKIVREPLKGLNILGKFKITYL